MRITNTILWNSLPDEIISALSEEEEESAMI